MTDSMNHLSSCRLRCCVTMLLAALASSTGTAPVSAQPATEKREPPRVYKDVEDALVVFRRGNLDGAYKLLKSAKEKHAELPPAEVMLARFLFAHKKVDLGKKWLQQAITKSPDDPEAYILLGNIALRSGEFAQADGLFEKGFERVGKLGKDDPRRKRLALMSLAGLATADQSRKLWSEAEQHLKDWLKIDPENAAALSRLARVYFLQEKYEEARATFAKLAKLNEKIPSAEVQMGTLYEQAGKRDLARREMMTALKAKPNDLQTRLAVARWAIYVGDLELAQENVDAATKIDPQDLTARLLQGIIHRFRGKLTEAEAIFSAVHAESPSNFDATNQLALTLVAQDDESKQRQALEYAKLNVRSHRDLRNRPGREAAATLAWVLLKTGNKEAALKAIQPVIKSGQFPPHVGYYAAEIFLSAGATKPAAQLAKAALNSPRSFPEEEQAKALLKKLLGPTEQP